MMSEPKRIHPIGMLLSIFKIIKQTALSYLPLLIIAISSKQWMYILIGAIAILVFLLVYTFLSWWRYTYLLEEDQIRIEQGIIVRKKRTISKHRIQSIDLSQNLIHRIFGLTKVQIETAGSDHNIDASLHAVTMEEGRYVHDQLKYNKQMKEQLSDEAEGHNLEMKEQPAHPFKKVTPRALIIAGSTSGSFGIILGLFAIGFSELETFIPDHFYNQATAWVMAQALQVLIALAIVVFIFIWVLGIVTTLIQYWDFTVTRYEKELYITRGLIEKKQSTIPLKRIQAIGMKESILRQPLGYASLYVEIASGEISQNGETTTLLFPLMKKAKVKDFLQEVLPEYDYTIDQPTSLPKRSLPYYLIRSILFPLLATIILAFTLLEWVYIPIIATILAAVFGYWQYKTVKFQLEKDYLFVQSRLLSRDTVIVKHSRIQSMQKKQHFLHRKQQLASINIAILNKFVGRHITIREMELDEAYQIADWYSYQKK
jgi:putative membrane protein